MYFCFEGMFYYVLGNLRPELRSTHCAIQLIACVECPVLEKYGFEKVLAPFIKDVNTLCNVRAKLTYNNNYYINVSLFKDGIKVDANGKTHEFYGTVLLVLADTVAAHQLGGFKVGVGFSLRVCRNCMATREMIQDKVCQVYIHNYNGKRALYWVGESPGDRSK